MKNIDLLVSGLEYIEEHIKDDLKTQDIAKACHCSKSTLEKLFQCVNGISVHNYIVRRRMMLAAKRISTNAGESILDIAVDCGYGSHEAFARAFKEVWNCTPSAFRERKFVELFPKLKGPVREGEKYVMQRRGVDISELYDLFCERRDCYFVGCDIKALLPINEISHKAGDLAIIESMNRMECVAGEDDIVFRIGGDEFCILTNSNDEAYAKTLADKIRSYNGQTFDYENKKIPLSLHVAVAKYTGKIMRYNDLFSELHVSIRDCK